MAKTKWHKALILGSSEKEIEFAYEYLDNKRAWKQKEPDLFYNKLKKASILIKAIDPNISLDEQLKKLIDKYKLELIINVGYATGLAFKSIVGDVVIGTQYIDLDNLLSAETTNTINSIEDNTKIDSNNTKDSITNSNNESNSLETLNNTLNSKQEIVNMIIEKAVEFKTPFFDGNIITSTKSVDTPEEAKQLVDNYEAIAVDNIASDIAKIAADNNVDFACIKAFSKIVNNDKHKKKINLTVNIRNLEETYGATFGVDSNHQNPDANKEDLPPIERRPIVLAVELVENEKKDLYRM